MIDLIVTLFFRSIWSLKSKCLETESPLRRRVLLLLYGAYQRRYSASIAWNSRFAAEPCLPHGIKGIFVSGSASLGRDCVIFQQVTIGSNTLVDSKGMGAPTIGDRCYIGAGAKIIGNVVIGNDVRIGANAVVTEDVPDRAVVTSGRAQVIVRAEAGDNRFYSFHCGWVYFQAGEWIRVEDEKVLARLSAKFSTNPEQPEGSSRFQSLP